MKNLEQRTLFLLIFLTIIGFFLRFYNINWGSPYFFHPDERNIASAVTKLEFPNTLNPQFFAYGSLPIYTIYVTAILVNAAIHSSPALTITFEQAIIISRFYSALFSVLLIPLLFVLARRINKQSDTISLLAAFLATTSVGFIQFAHFGTFEMWLTFFSVLLFWLCLEKMTKTTIILMGIVFGILVATKVSSLALLPLPLFAMVIYQSRNQHHAVIAWIKTGIIILRNIILLLLTSAFVYIVSNPYVFLDTGSFKSSMQYESTLALGTLKVFYTGEFFNTIPVLYQLKNVYPFLLNPLIALVFIPSFFYLIYKMFKTRSLVLLLLNSYFLILTLSQAFLFVKWTRYMVPTLPFIYLIVATSLSLIVRSEATRQYPMRLPRSLQSLAMTMIILICTVFSISYFITAFVEQDTRIAAKQFAKQSISSDAPILSEVYDLGITSFNDSFSRIDLFNFYDIDPNSPGLRGASTTLPLELQNKLANSEYIILPSQRLLKIRLQNKKQFPNGYTFYKSLLTGELGYRQIYRSPCSIFCRITYLGDSVFRYEETANIFDRPTVYIFKKNINL